MGVKIADLVFTSIEDIVAFSLTDEYLFTLDELQNATIAQTEDKTDITGKMGRKLSSIKRNKSVTVSATNGLVSAGLSAIQMGDEGTTGEVEIETSEYLSATDAHKVTLGHVATGILAIYETDEDGLITKTFAEDSNATPEAGKYHLGEDKKEITFNEEVAKDANIVVYYKRKISAPSMENKSDKYAGKCKLYVNAIAENKSGIIYHVQYFVPKADISGEWSLELGENQTVHAFSAEALSGAGGKAGTFYKMIVFGENAEDVA